MVAPSSTHDLDRVRKRGGRDVRLAAIYELVLRRAVQQFFPGADLVALGPTDVRASPDPTTGRETSVALAWQGQAYVLNTERQLTPVEQRLVQCTHHVLAGSLVAAGDGDHGRREMSGIPEDQVVAEFLCSESADRGALSAAVVADVLGVLHTAASRTYENRRITTGALLDFRTSPEVARIRSAAACRYSQLLTTSKTFLQLCDGVRTVAALDADGYFVGIADISQSTTVSSPSATSGRFAAHAAATLDGQCLCAVLTERGDIKVFAEGEEFFTFTRGRWQLRDVGWKWTIAEERMGSAAIARALLGASINLAEQRRGGLFVVIDDGVDVNSLVKEGDRLDASPSVSEKTSKQSFHYLLRGSNILTLAAPILETIAAIDGAVVVGRDGGILAVAAILPSDAATRSTEGARTAAAIAASRFGTALMVSEDGVISLVAARHVVWTL
jgi:hypothetical protein